MTEIHDLQASDEGLLLQRAADGSHIVAHRIEMVRLTVSTAFGLAAIAAAVWPAAAVPISIAGAAWALLSFGVLGIWSQRESVAAALAQERFDTWLFRLPWSQIAIDAPLPEEELRRRARRSTLPKDRMDTWYPNVSGIPHLYGVLVCQRENLSWDERLRRRYATLLTIASIGWIVLGITIGLVADLSARELALRWFVPSTSVLLLAAQQRRGQAEIANQKDVLAERVRAELDNADAAATLSDDEEHRLTTVIRAIQDGLLSCRKRGERVPRWFYERFRDQDESDMRETAAQTVDRLTVSTSPSRPTP